MPNKQPPRRRLWYLFFGLTFLGYIWPGLTIANRIEPYVFGFPFLFAWFIGLVLLQFAGLLVMYFTGDQD
jgi:hypothetical protein